MHTILVVDDDQKLLKMLQRTLVYENLNVLTATNGEEALPIVDAQKPDLLIVDWMMPKMDGVTLIRHLRADENKTMVLMLTARDAIENRVDGLESGADDYLVKPFAPAELVARVHALLRRIEPKPETQAVSYLDVSLDPSTREAKRGEASLALTLTEFNLLHLLRKQPGFFLQFLEITCAQVTHSGYARAHALGRSPRMAVVALHIGRSAAQREPIRASHRGLPKSPYARPEHPTSLVPLWHRARKPSSLLRCSRCVFAQRRFGAQ